MLSGVKGPTAWLDRTKFSTVEHGRCEKQFHVYNPNELTLPTNHHGYNPNELTLPTN
jgi:hypothetical protein